MDIIGNFEEKLKELPNEKAEKISISRGFISKVNSKRKKTVFGKWCKGVTIKQPMALCSFLNFLFK
jgi:hypothetical protein